MRASLEIDEDLVREAGLLLGTSTLTATVDAALREIVTRHRRIGLIRYLAEQDDLDFESAQKVWGGTH